MRGIKSQKTPPERHDWQTVPYTAGGADYGAQGEGFSFPDGVVPDVVVENARRTLFNRRITDYQ